MLELLVLLVILIALIISIIALPATFFFDKHFLFKEY